jgi:hypothetical protein
MSGCQPLAAILRQSAQRITEILQRCGEPSCVGGIQYK